jgi:serine phosphatase RsbU (regulator of sigma subunit)
MVFIRWPLAVGRWPLRVLFLEFALKSDPAADTIGEVRLDDAGEPVGAFAQTLVYDPRDRPWYVEAIARDGAGFSDVFGWSRQGGGTVLGLGYGEPIDLDGERLGVIDTGLALGDFSRYLAGLDLGGGVAFLIDGEGKLLGAGAGRVTDDAGEQLWAVEADDPVIAAAARALMQPPPQELRAPPPPFTFQTSTTVPDLGRLRVESTPVACELPWRIVTVVPEDDFMGEVRAARRFTLAAGIGCVGLALVGGLMLGRRAVRPVLETQRQVKGIGGGDLDTPITLGGAREFVDLGQSLDTMRRDLKDNLRLRQSIEVAMEVQQNLLPCGPPTVSGLDVAGKSVYCDETGGDYFDYIEMDGGDGERLVLALGDVMGHGVAAALLMTTARAALRSRAREPGSLADLLRHVNELLVPDTGGTKFMTMALAVIDPTARTLRWASAGHDAPILFDPATDTFTEPEGGDMPMGIMAGVAYEEYEVGPLAPGTIMLLGTDGIWEAQNAAEELWGKPALQDVIRQHQKDSAEALNDAIHAAVDTHINGPRDDDVTLVVVKLAPTTATTGPAS